MGEDMRIADRWSALYWMENMTRSDMYAEIPRASIRFLLVKVSVMLMAPWIRRGGYAIYPQPRVMLNRCAPRPEEVRGMVISQVAH
jgi:hypothetical protein